MSAAAPRVKGWCPGAYRPMLSGDGLVVRVRPVLARFSCDQVQGICALSEAYGNGILEFTNRANLQLRGVTDTTLPALLDGLEQLGVLDNDPALEGRAQHHHPAALDRRRCKPSHGEALRARIADLPDLPAKFGFAVDLGEAPLLSKVSADIRLERAKDSALMVRLEGVETGFEVAENQMIDRAIEVAQWFARQSTPQTNRMAKLVRGTLPPTLWTGVPPAASAPKATARASLPGVSRRDPLWADQGPRPG